MARKTEPRTFVQTIRVEWTVECPSAAEGLRMIERGEAPHPQMFKTSRIRFWSKPCPQCGGMMFRSGRGVCYVCRNLR